MWFSEPSLRTYCLCVGQQSTACVTQVRRTHHSFALLFCSQKSHLSPSPGKVLLHRPLLHFPKLLAVPPPPHSPLSHLGYCHPSSPFMLLTLLRNVVFLAGKKGPEGQANGEMMNTWFPHVLLIFSRTASLAVFLLLFQLEI